MEGFVNLAVFSLPVDVAVLPVMTFLAVLVAFSEGKMEYAPRMAA